ncbi:putative Phospho-N-acetylmuramoyl-pentapeptide-transferase [Quillaja saponaria]|uniref:Phospho-N-acetylmuramoyl-pentapeptide-transferase n=1 Tax=Quillaja saponaria TaxID=32244 RepID=A0AAD7KYJ6_QUISA|nr:putative Phospho-N-acetylmuramoyl-pentapeptide-transferase [Quillaja saponaria]
MMKKSGFIAASMAAASATAVSVSCSSSSFTCNSNLQFSHQDSVTQRDNESSLSGRSSSAEKFAPRFDGLRFIETLITGHR